MHAALAILWPSCGAAELAGDGRHDFGRTARRCKVRGRAEGEVLALEDDRHGLKKRIADPQRIANFGTAAQYQVRFQPPHTLSFACEPLI